MTASVFTRKSRLSNQIAGSRDRLYQVALAWCGDAMVADDLVQETLAAGIVNYRQLRDEKRLLAWLYSIMHNNWVKYLRKNKSHLELDNDYASDLQGPLDDCQELEIVCRVRQAVAALPGDQRQVIALIDLEGLSYQEVSEALSIPIGTVMSRLHRARKNLLAKLEAKPFQPVTGLGTVRLVE